MNKYQEPMTPTFIIKLVMESVMFCAAPALTPPARPLLSQNEDFQDPWKDSGAVRCRHMFVG